MRMRAAIVGIGASSFQRRSAESPLALTATALTAAVKDAQLEPSAIDGLVVNTGNPRGLDYDVAAQLLGLKIRFSSQGWGHGRFVATSVQTAALAVGAGLADVVAVLYTSKQSMLNSFGGYDYPEAFARESGGPHGEVPHQGLTAPASGAAMALRAYLERYGVDSERLADVVIALRAHAVRNPDALYRTAVNIDDYRSSPPIIDPLRRLDCAPPTDGAVALIVASTQRGPATRRAVAILGMQGLQAGREEFIFGRPGLGVEQQAARAFRPSNWDLASYEQAGIERSDIGAFYTYDAFSPLVWFALERFGFCGEGEAPVFSTVERIGPGGAFPVNTNGGLLSEGHLSGFNQLAEMVRQVRGEAGERQVANAKPLQWGSCLGDSLILGR
jgi:acetyl-CoA acetyltransferase